MDNWYSSPNLFYKLTNSVDTLKANKKYVPPALKHCKLKKKVFPFGLATKFCVSIRKILLFYQDVHDRPDFKEVIS